MKYIYKYLTVMLALLLLWSAAPPAAAEEIVPPGQNAAVGGADDGQKGEEAFPDKEAADHAGDGGELIQPNAGSGSGSSVVDSDDDYQGNVILPQEQDEEDDPVIGSDDDDWSAASQVLTENGTVVVSDSVTYDPKTGLYIYPVGDSGNEVHASVANGMIVTGSVKIVGKTLIIYRDGLLWEGDPTLLTEPGEYVVMAQTGNQTPRLFTFTLAGSANSSIYGYSLPSGMIVTGATRNGEDTDYDRSTVPMQADGLYHIEYESLSTGAKHVLDINIDRTPPELQFSGSIDENNRVHSALGFSGLQEGDTIQATLDGAEINVRVNADGTGEFTDSGSYIITVFDAAGNSTVYGYIVMLYFNASGLAFFAVIAASLLALGVYIFIKRKRLEIG